MGRHSIYTPETAQFILDQLAQGESLRSICALPTVPSRSVIYDWITENVDGFSDRYARARDIGLDVVAEEVMQIADEEVGCLENGATDSGAVAHKRLRFDARRWYLSKLAPKRYGDKVTTEVTGADGGPIQVDDASAASKLATLLATAEARKRAQGDDKTEDDYSDLV